MKIADKSRLIWQHVNKLTILTNLAYCTIIVCTIPRNASYEGKRPVRPVSVYPCNIPWHVCSERISITRPPLKRAFSSHWKLRPVASKTASDDHRAHGVGWLCCRLPSAAAADRISGHSVRRRQPCSSTSSILRMIPRRADEKQCRRGG